MRQIFNFSVAADRHRPLGGSCQKELKQGVLVLVCIRSSGVGENASIRAAWFLAELRVGRDRG